MKKNSTLITLTFIVICFVCQIRVNAQPMGANGAIWHYSLQSFIPPIYNSPVVLTAGSPVTINNYQITPISSSFPGCMVNNSGIMQSNDTVYYYLPNVNMLSMLYNFNAMIGDTQTVYTEYPTLTLDSLVLLVTDTGSIVINGLQKRTYTTTQLSGSYMFGGLMIEDIGNSDFLFPQYGFCDPPTGPIRCYEDSIMGLAQFDSLLSCDTIVVGIEENAAELSVTMEPNPFTDIVKIHSNNLFPVTGVRIFNSVGQEVFRKTTWTENSGNDEELDLGFLREGLYFIELKSNSQAYCLKIIRQR